jgi:site-specific recombinase XerD
LIPLFITAALLQAFFTDRLMSQRHASPNTIASHRDTFRLLLRFAQDRLKRTPSTLAVEELDATFIGAFLDHLEKERGNSPRSRNVRLAGIHSFFRYVAVSEPSLSAVAQHVLAIPSKRFKTRPIEFLTRPEIEALLAAPDRRTWGGRRDHALMLVAVQTGLRVSELVGLCVKDVVLGVGAHVRCTGKGRKERCTPLRKEAVVALQAWFQECNARSSDPAFPSSRGGHLSRDAVEHLVAKYAAAASKRCTTLKNKCVTPHVLRHTAAMELHLCGVDLSVIALWLGHESIETTQIYLHADMKQKEAALAKTQPFNVKPGRFQPDDELLAFLQNL